MNSEYRAYLAEGERAGMRYMLAVPREAMSGLVGFDMGRQAGSSLDFKDYREYQPGDDLRHIDWHAFARSDRLTVKLYREEVSPHLDIVLDGTRSMTLDGTAKARASLGLSAAFWAAAVNARCTSSCWLAGHELRRFAASSAAPSTWEGLSLDYAGSPAGAIAGSDAFRRNGIRVFISDLLWPGEPLQIVQRLSHGAAGVVIVQLLAKADVEAPMPGNAALIDAETGEMLEAHLDANARQRYADALAAHAQHWRMCCRRARAQMVTIIAEDVTADWNLSSLTAAQVLEAV